MATVTFGKHKGKNLKDVPTDYLVWVCKTSMEQESYFPGIEAITKELRDRACRVELSVTDHALERAGQRMVKIYKQKRKPNERMTSWLLRVFEGVLKFGQMRKSYTARDGKKFRQPRYEYFYKDSIWGKEWKFVTEGNDISQKLITVFAPDN